jgi:hypothetical protein
MFFASRADTELQLREVEGRLVWTFGGTKRENKAEILGMLADDYIRRISQKPLGSAGARFQGLGDGSSPISVQQG